MELFRGVSKEEKESLINFILSVSPSHKDQEDGAHFRSDSLGNRAQLLELAKQLSLAERTLILPLILHMSPSSGEGITADLIHKTSQLIRETAPESQEFLLILLKDLYDLQKERVEPPSSYYVGTRQNPSDFLKSVKDIPSSDREIILSLSLQLAKPQMNLHNLRTLFQKLQSVSPEDRESIVADTRLLSSTAMDQEDRNQRRSFSGGEHSKISLLEGLRRFPTIQRESLILMTLHLVAPHMNVHDRLRIMESLSRVPSEQRETRVQEVMLRLSEDIIDHGMTERERFSRIIQLLENPRASFTRRSIYVTGEEALMQEQKAVIAVFRQLLSHPSTSSLIAKNLPSRDGFFESYCTNFLKNLDLLSLTVRSPQEQFRLLKAKEGLEYLRKIRAEFSIDYSIPSIRKIFGLVYNLVNTGFTAETFIEAWIVEKEVSNPRDWEQFKAVFFKSFPDLMGHETAGRILEVDKEKGKRFVRCLRSMIEDEEIEISFKERVYLKRIMKDYCVAFKERNTPLIEALLMSVRGHNRNLLDPQELNRYACADGVMVGILRSLTEIRETQEISRPLAFFEKVSCQ
ncbi:MAG TPA: hypothetical protein PLY23_08745 [Alphaproteobacteria bacterium]|nr:hypothetical protein [Alphaproteobacteria bacterium]HQS94753.1 hypothetical protein [Alphaproteobacteria bacterium]